MDGAQQAGSIPDAEISPCVSMRAPTYLTYLKKVLASGLQGPTSQNLLVYVPAGQNALILHFRVLQVLDSVNSHTINE